jgi:tetratricopeptide (TPR) repeat protein
MAAVLLAASAVGGAASQAQTTEPVTPERTEDRLRSLERAGEAGAEAGTAIQAREVDFADILAAPDDVELNLAYARTQIARGDLKGASATLQRVLLLRPEAAEVRALYGIVLYRLGDLAGAERALRQALDQGLPGTALSQAQRYLELARTAQQTTTGEVVVTLGAAYDSNRNAAPDGGQQLFRDIRIAADDPNDDVAAIAVAQGSVRHDLGFQRKHALVANGTAYAQEQFDENRYDLEVVSGDGGVSLDLGQLTLVPGLRGSYFRLDGEDYIAAGGLQVDGVYRIRPDLRVTLDSFAQYEGFYDTAASPTAGERSGWRTHGRLGLGWNTQSVGIEIGFSLTRKEAEEAYEAYTAYTPDIRATLLLGQGQFVLGEFDYEIRRYDDNDPFVSRTIRDDTGVRLGLTYGVPLGTIFGDGFPAPLAPVNLLLSVEGNATDSNLDNYSYSNVRGQALLSRRFRF